MVQFYIKYGVGSEENMINSARVVREEVEG